MVWLQYVERIWTEDWDHTGFIGGSARTARCELAFGLGDAIARSTHDPQCVARTPPRRESAYQAEIDDASAAVVGAGMGTGGDFRVSCLLLTQSRHRQLSFAPLAVVSAFLIQIKLSNALE